MEYYYWNKDNFESLEQLAKQLSETPELARVAEYCLLRERGLRKQALVAVRAFVAEAASFPAELRLELAVRLLELHYAAPAAHQFLCQPLTDFIRPVLRKAARPGNTAFRYLALLNSGSRRSEGALRAVLRHDPSDTMVRKRLASIVLGHADFAMHHLGESRFIGSEEYCGQVLHQAAQLLVPPFSEHPALQYLIEEYEYLSAMFADWLAYKEEGSDTPFPDWCAVRGHRYGWPVAVYYTP